jgi:predicted  nucleic acid-binding Zn-ribbon protein
VVQSSVKDTLKKLVALQKIDAHLFEYRREMRENPAKLNELKAKFDRKKDRLLQLENKAKDLERSKKAQELELKAKDEAIAKADGALMTLKTNKEYQAKLFEIENLKADKSVIENDVLKFMEELETLAKEIEKEKGVIAAEEKAYLAEKEKVDEANALVQLKVDELGGERKQAIEGIDHAALKLYERIVENRDGLALVPIVGNSCGGCFMNTPPQVVNKMKMYDELVRCEMCARLLYLQEDM